jgi:hypothetical protein
MEHARATLDYWTPADALAFRCSVAEVGTLKPADVSRETQPGNLREDVAEARLYAGRAFRALVRVMEGDSPRAALEAAKEILLRAYGPALAPAPLPAPGAAPEGVPPHPEWLEAQRLAYRAGEYLPGQNEPGQCLPGQCQPGQCLPRQ